MSALENVTLFRVRYCETDQMGTYSSGAVLDWFEIGRTEWLRQAAIPYTRMESRGVLLPVVEAHVEYPGRSAYDDELRILTTAEMVGRARVRFDMRIERASDSSTVAAGWTVHAFCDPSGRPIRPPQWILDALASEAGR